MKKHMLMFLAALLLLLVVGYTVSYYPWLAGGRPADEVAQDWKLLESYGVKQAAVSS